METPQVIGMRLHWNPSQPIDGYSFLYEMLLLVNDDNQIIAARDHSVIVPNPPSSASSQAAVVHLSHIWIADAERGKHTDFLSDEHPVSTAREAIARAGLPGTTQVILAAEAEPYQSDNDERVKRLRIFRAMRYLPIDPNKVSYLQPDFRPPEQIDAEGGPKPLPLTLLIKQIGHEKESSIKADTVRHIVTCLYRMYGTGMLKKHMQCVYDSLSFYPTGNEPVSLQWKNAGLE